MNPLISIIIPAYNEEDLIAECLESIKSQSYKNLEVIVVDDGSRDRTLEIAKGLKVKTMSQYHKGPGSARNLAASHAKGKILVFVDADMTFDKNFIRDLVAPILHNRYFFKERNEQKHQKCLVCLLEHKQKFASGQAHPA